MCVSLGVWIGSWISGRDGSVGCACADGEGFEGLETASAKERARFLFGIAELSFCEP